LYDHGGRQFISLQKYTIMGKPMNIPVT